jgi:putative ABC transport system permease protein
MRFTMLNADTLPLRTLRHQFLRHVPVALGVAIATTVLVGALLIGDSLRSSLKARSDRQLYGIESVYLGSKFIQYDTAKAIGPEVIPAIVLQGSLSVKATNGDEQQINNITVYGVAEADREKLNLPMGIQISARLPQGNSYRLNLEKRSKIARSSIIGKRDAEDVTKTIVLRDAKALPEDHPLNDFSLRPDPTPPLNIFVPIELLQDKPLEIGPKVNALFSKSGDAAALTKALQAKLTLADWGLVVQPDADNPSDSKLRREAFQRTGVLSVESDRAILDDTTVSAILESAKAVGSKAEPTLAYLANGIYPGTEKLLNDDRTTKTPVMGYAILAAVDLAAPAPLGPFLPPGVANLKDDEIALLDWPDSPLRMQRLDQITVSYFLPEMETKATEAWATFKFAGWVPFSGAANDPNLTPPFPGVTDKLKIKDWDAPFPINPERVKDPAVDSFWNDHQATPKAYITRATGEKLFGSRFGKTTSVRVAGTTDTAVSLRKELLKRLDPDAAGFKIESIRELMNSASGGGTDFGAMMIAFSVFLILAAMILVGLLFRLVMDQRAKEIGLLLAVGYSPKLVLRNLLLEGFIVVLLGAIPGVLLAMLYAWGMLNVLIWLWPDGNVGQYLRPYFNPVYMVIGVVGVVLMALVTIWLSVRKLVKVAPPALLRGSTRSAEESVKEIRPKSWPIPVCLVVGVGLLIGGAWAATADQRAGAFFGGGLFLLGAGLLAIRRWMLRPRSDTALSLPQLATRNMGRSCTRSLLTVSLLALATFLVVAVESFRKQPNAEFASPNGGSGGYSLYAESDTPLFHPLDSAEGRDEMLKSLGTVYQDREARDPTVNRETLLNEAESNLKQLKALSFRLRDGDDASCLNLYQAGRPRILGVPKDLTGFAFAMSEASTPEEKANPWLLLDKPRDDGTIPVIVEINTALWMLKTFLGGTVVVPDESGKDVKLRIVGLLQDSVFQSELLVSSKTFQKLFPGEEGFRFFLVQPGAVASDNAVSLLQSGHRASGLSVQKSADRVAAYQAVIGAYLTTFQLLGGLGLLLGVCGLAAVLLRSTFERSGEFALLRAVGYRVNHLEQLTQLEHWGLLLAGVGLGAAVGLASVVPYLALGGKVGSLRLVLILVGVIVVGLLVVWLATLRASRQAIVPALRRE